MPHDPSPRAARRALRVVLVTALALGVALVGVADVAAADIRPVYDASCHVSAPEGAHCDAYVMIFMGPTYD